MFRLPVRAVQSALTSSRSSLFHRTLHTTTTARMPCHYYTPAEEREIEAKERRELEKENKLWLASFCDAMALFNKTRAGVPLTAVEEACFTNTLLPVYLEHRAVEHEAMVVELKRQQAKTKAQLAKLASAAKESESESHRLQEQLKSDTAKLEFVESAGPDSPGFSTKGDDNWTEEGTYGPNYKAMK